MRISDWSSDVCSSDLTLVITTGARHLRTISKSGSKRGLLSWVRRLTAGGAGREPSGSASDSASPRRSEEHTSELQSLMRISYAVFCLKKKNIKKNMNG